jgi:hypothetical protein
MGTDGTGRVLGTRGTEGRELTEREGCWEREGREGGRREKAAKRIRRMQSWDRGGATARGRVHSS